ncbi:MAG: large-conductance mechanosensitive channel protein MscL [Candidatus Moranbacteria bacterium]|jgi:large conductance mechanosensitive channel|nr:large-conductance mechanosensitive channel protein MscL [Candidatus Moranbacteria bacterium]MDD5651795.1 large-conductance mechanosensitive channel protein MscL [Candidatus Moranbacteria bacterium]MDX9855794.1 large-conductance mechanosensitive channel protein MscL [Candidatus Moranbacteria bacterium]
MFKDFKKFAIKGNVVDLAIGVVIGTAFSKIVSSFVSDIIMPPLGVLTGGVDFSDLSLTLKKATEDSQAVAMNYGLFIDAVINFFIISFSIFIVIRQFERFKKKEEKKPQRPPEEVRLLREIRDELKKR